MSLFFFNSTYKWDHTIFSFLWLKSLSIMPSISFFFFMFIYFWEREHESGRGRERGRQRILSRLHAVSSQTQAGLEPMNPEIKTWAEAGSSTDWATQVPLIPSSIHVVTNSKIFFFFMSEYTCLNIYHHIHIAHILYPFIFHRLFLCRGILWIMLQWHGGAYISLR